MCEQNENNFRLCGIPMLQHSVYSAQLRMPLGLIILLSAALAVSRERGTLRKGAVI